jgi:hypothetical protein
MRSHTQGGKFSKLYAVVAQHGQRGTCERDGSAAAAVEWALEHSTWYAPLRSHTPPPPTRSLLQPSEVLFVATASNCWR